ncbi:hypothetical protein JCM13664_16870 [Methylothermus subterraneus]
MGGCLNFVLLASPRLKLWKAMVFVVGLAAGTCAVAGTQARLTAGWLEWVVLEPFGLKLKGKLDTGAKTSSLHAVDIEYFERDGKAWVRFKTFDPRRKAEPVTIERPLIRDVRIKRHTAAYQQRPVVALDVCLDDRLVRAEFSLIDRGRFNYPVLLGRSLLKQERILVDPAATYVLDTRLKRCKVLVDSASSSKAERALSLKDRL